MKGLNSPELLSFLQANSVVIYCSRITKAILSSWTTYSSLTPYLKFLEINQNVKIDTVKNERSNGAILELVVTLIPTGHCPGSVM